MRALAACLLLAIAGCPAHTSRPPAPAPPAPAVTTPGTDAPADADFVAPRFTRTNLGDSGLSAYLPPGYPAFEVSTSDDGSPVFTGEMTVGGYHYGAIAVHFLQPLDASAEETQSLLVSYLDYLKTQLGITGAAGYGLGRTLDSAPSAQGALDYWQDGDGGQWVVEGWITADALAVLYINGATDYPSPTAAQMYLEGLRFTPAP